MVFGDNMEEVEEVCFGVEKKMRKGAGPRLMGQTKEPSNSID